MGSIGIASAITIVTFVSCFMSHFSGALKTLVEAAWAEYEAVQKAGTICRARWPCG
jgi:hypothetical protein